MNDRQLGNMTWKAEEYEKLLRELCQRVEGADQILIRKTLEMVSRPMQITFVQRSYLITYGAYRSQPQRMKMGFLSPVPGGWVVSQHCTLDSGSLTM